MSEAPQNLKYAQSHEWVEVDGDIATVGISDHAAELLGDLVFVELPELDDEINAADALAVVESVKAASDVFSPIGGKIIEINSDLEDSPELINESAFSGGWICKIKMSDIGELDDLMDADAYLESLSEED
jgi:glycine cleavage system H protein